MRVILFLRYSEKSVKYQYRISVKKTIARKMLLQTMTALEPNVSFFFHSSDREYLKLQTDSGKIAVYCHMTSHGIGAFGGGGWTLVMKIDGHEV